MLNAITNPVLRRCRTWSGITLLFIFSFFTTLGQSVPIKGSVSDKETNEPLAGITINLKGSQTSVVTDESGRFSIDVPNPDRAILLLSGIGYSSVEWAVKGTRELTIRLNKESRELDDVIVVGYGTQRKSDLTGSIARVKGSDLSKGAVASITQGLQGRAAGVQITRQGGQPGEGSTVRVRGSNSFSGGEPLYVIDGLPIYNENGALLNPNDVESVEILKDASATAIYGSRGANGVILVTTKKGREGKAKIVYDGYYGMQSVMKKLDMANAKEYATLYNARLKALSQPARFTDAEIGAMGEGTDWQSEIFQDAPLQNHQLSISGGAQKINYFVSGNLYDEEGIVRGGDLTRYSIRSNISAQATSKLKVGANINYTFAKRNITQSDQDGDGRSNFLTSVVHGSLLFSPISPIKNPDGSYVVQNPDFPAIDNPVAITNTVTNERFTKRLLGNIFAEYQFLPNLKGRINVGGDFSNETGGQYLPRTTILGRNNNGYSIVTSRDNNNTLANVQLEYNKTFAANSITALAVYEAQSSTGRTFETTSTGFANDALNYHGSANTVVTSGTANTIGESSIQSYLARINYAYDDRYLLTLSGRYDGSSRFGANNRYAFFPSAAIAWKVSEEKFLENAKNISDIKLRVSYGVTGNQEIGNYSSYSLLGARVTTFNGVNVTGFVPQNLGNSDLKWESNAQFDVGADIGLFKNRLQITLDYYHKKASDVLVGLNVPFTSGYNTVTQNVGNIENKGFEVTLQTKNFVGAFQWNSSLNVSINRNKVTDLGPIQEFFSNNGSGWLAIPSFTLVRVGEPLGLFYGHVFDGIFQEDDNIAGSAQPTAKPGHIRYKDMNKDNVINDFDRTIIGSAQPDFIYGFVNDFFYKGFDLSVFIQGSQGNEIVNAQTKNLNYFTAEGNVSKNALNYWTRENRSQTIPSLTNPNIRYASNIIEDGSYVRLKNITLGYTLPAGIANRMRIGSLRVYISGQNIATITDYTGFDPEVNRFRNSSVSPGVDAGSYPTPKTWMAGISLGF